MGLKLSQIIGVDMKRQIMITNVWVEQVNKLTLDHFIIRKKQFEYYALSIAYFVIACEKLGFTSLQCLITRKISSHKTKQATYCLHANRSIKIPVSVI